MTLKSEFLIESDLYFHGFAFVAGELEGVFRLVKGDDVGDDGFAVDQALVQKGDGHSKFRVKAEGATQLNFLRNQHIQRYLRISTQANANNHAARHDDGQTGTQGFVKNIA